MTSLIIEDSRLARKELVGLLADFPDIDIIGEAADGDGALRLIREKQPDLLFLDIDLPGKNGFELLGELSQLPLVIFTTAFDEYALRSFDYNAVDYLLKPIRKDRLARAIEKAKRSVHNADQVAKERLGLEHRIFVKDGERCWFVTLRDLQLLESVGNYCRLYFGEERPLILKSLNYLEDVLDPKVFFRINRAQIVNLKEVDQILPWLGGRLQLTLKSGEKLEVSRRQTAKLKDIYSL
ncbi:MAG: LytTR family DNA-binding domain-containing protein [Bacteroidota bacterium]